MEIIPTLKPNQKQHQAYSLWFDKDTLYLLYGGAAGGGKSWWICEKQIYQAYRYPGIKSFIGRKELKRLMNSTYLTFLKVCSFHNIPKTDFRLDGKYNFIEFNNGSRIDLLDLDYFPSDPLYERLGSLEYTNGDIEEGGEIRELAFETLKSRVGRHKNQEFNIPGKIGITCNPTKNFLYRTFYKPFKNNTLPKEYAFVQALYTDNPYTAGEYKKQLSGITDRTLKERLMFGNWEYDSDPTSLINYEAIVDLFTNTTEESRQKYITVDAARLGNDRIVIYLWSGLSIDKIVIKTKQTLNYTAEDIKKIADDFKVPFSHIIIDEDGVGGGLVDMLSGVLGFVANSKPFNTSIPKLDNQTNVFRPDNYINLKAQCSYKLAEYINNHKIAIKCEDASIREQIIEELEQIKSDSEIIDGKLKLVSKDRVKETLGRSPDLSDAMMMRMYFEMTGSDEISKQEALNRFRARQSVISNNSR